MNDIERAIETLRKISDIETQHNYEELHKIQSFNYNLLTAIEALQEKSEREKELEMFKNGDLVFSSLSDDATISVLKQWVGEKEVKDKLIKILEEEQEREKGCKYCQTVGVSNKQRYKSKIDNMFTESYFTIQPYKSSQPEMIVTGFLTKSTGLSNMYFEINYCPYCGRKLR